MKNIKENKQSYTQNVGGSGGEILHVESLEKIKYEVRADRVTKDGMAYESIFTNKELGELELTKNKKYTINGLPWICPGDIN